MECAWAGFLVNRERRNPALLQVIKCTWSTMASALTQRNKERDSSTTTGEDGATTGINKTTSWLELFLTKAIATQRGSIQKPNNYLSTRTGFAKGNR